MLGNWCLCSFFKCHLLPFCLELAVDKVVDIRMAVAGMMPSLNACCAMNVDDSLAEQLCSAQDALLRDLNCHVARTAAEALDGVKVPSSTQC